MSTQYDDVFRTIAKDCPDLLVPLINEVFGENYPEEAEIRFYPNEHFINQKDGKTQERITDTCFELSADTTKNIIWNVRVRPTAVCLSECLNTIRKSHWTIAS